MLLHSPYPAAAFMPHISTLVYPTPAHSLPYPNIELEFRRRKPPDRGGGERRPIYYAVNEKVPLSVTKHSPLNGISPMLSVVPPTCQGWAEARCLSNVELDWRACCKPPNALGISQQHGTGFSTNDKTSVNGCSPLNGTVRTASPLVKPAQGKGPLRPDDGLIWQVHKHPEVTGRRLLLEAVNKIKGGREWAHLPVFRPTSAPYACSPTSWLTFALLAWNCFHMAFASIIHCYLREMPVILHANGKSWLWASHTNFANIVYYEEHTSSY